MKIDIDKNKRINSLASTFQHVIPRLQLINLPGCAQEMWGKWGRECEKQNKNENINFAY